MSAHTIRRLRFVLDIDVRSYLNTIIIIIIITIVFIFRFGVSQFFLPSYADPVTSLFYLHRSCKSTARKRRLGEVNNSIPFVLSRNYYCPGPYIIIIIIIPSTFEEKKNAEKACMYCIRYIIRLEKINK